MDHLRSVAKCGLLSDCAKVWADEFSKQSKAFSLVSLGVIIGLRFSFCYCEALNVSNFQVQLTNSVKPGTQ